MTEPQRLDCAAAAGRAERCETCRWWERAGNHGDCHRLPPQLLYDGVADDDRFYGWFPETFPAEWCGEWAPLPAKPPSTGGAT